MEQQMTRKTQRFGILCKSIVMGIAIIAIAVLQSLATIHNIDGKLTSLSIGAICLIVGITIKDIIELIKGAK
jgi:hypothetical protein